MPKITLRDVHWSNETGRLARNIAASDALSALLPQDEVNKLLGAYASSTEALEAARALLPEVPDVFEQLDPAFRAGEAVDPAKLIAAQAEVLARRDQVVLTIGALAKIPDVYRFELEELINNSVDSFTEGLDAQLQALLDEAEPLLAEMPGVTDGDSAIDAGKADQWARFRELHRRYQALRQDHLKLLKAADQRNFGERSPAVGHAWFANLDEAVPNYAQALQTGTQHPDPRMVGWQVAGLPFPVNHPADLGHWLAVVRDRAQLQPVAEYADEAVSRMVAANQRMAAEQEPGFQPEPGRLAREFGGELNAARHSYVAQRARSQATIATPKVLQPFDGVGFGHSR